MPRYIREEIEQGEMMIVYLDDQFDENSPEYLIKNFVETHTSESQFNQYYKNDEKGRKAKHPKDMLAGIIYGYYYGMRTGRQIEEALKRNIAFKYVANKLRADHSVICEFKVKFKNEIAELFGKILYVLNEMGGVDFERIIGDGTVIAGHAWKEMTVSGKNIHKKIKQFTKLSKRIVERDIENIEKHQKGEVNSKSYEEESLRIDRQKKKYSAIIRKMEEYEQKLEKGEIDPKKKHNLTDPDSSLLVKEKGRSVHQGYNAKMMISNNDVILSIDCDTTHERHCMKGMVEEIELLKNELLNKKKSNYLLDANFFDIHRILELEDVGCNMYVDPKAKDFSDKAQKRKYFQLITGDEISLRCMNGLIKKGALCKDKNNREWYNFYFRKSFCTGCLNLEICFKNVKRAKTVRFEKYEIENKDRIDKYIKKMGSVEGKKEYNRRIGKEHVFSNFKNQKNHTKTHYRGKEKVLMDLHLGGIAHNIGKYIKLCQKNSFHKAKMIA
jgi:transposase